jgi:hypothetical protein
VRLLDVSVTRRSRRMRTARGIFCSVKICFRGKRLTETPGRARAGAARDSHLSTFMAYNRVSRFNFRDKGHLSFFATKRIKSSR